MKIYLIIAQIIISAILIACVLLQAQGSGLGATWGGGGETFHTRRGLEKVIFIVTIICCCLFTLTSISLLLVR
ncbi:MAG: preprotein translocase subunit SecG [Candidatus Pacebacteria bacterium CG_4_10_14_0_8_um_filter_43_12]|nr:MAG: preprotein translocase subunit SecG [Candidatus Pacebacteria bacterium CG_4_10_14_0_8_um_filter_43_12]